MRHPIDPWVFMIVPLAVLGLGYLVAMNRRGAVSSTQIRRRRTELRSAADPATVFERLRLLGGRYRTDEDDRLSHALVLSFPPTFATWGFFYPVRIHAEGSGSRIEVGIVSRFVQFGPMVTRAHKRCVEDIEAAITVPIARIA